VREHGKEQHPGNENPCRAHEEYGKAPAHSTSLSPPVLPNCYRLPWTGLEKG
jgi:hypothetical protein